MPDPVVEYVVDPLVLGTPPFEVQAYRIDVPVGVGPLPGGVVTLIAHEIVFDDGAVLDVSGTPGGAPVPPAAASGGSPGASGSPGTTGQNGTDAGSITLYAEVITGTAALIANGGVGGPGQDGGDGIAGENGASGQDGEDGGAAGAGGPGGNGGQGGKVVVLCADLSGANLSFSVLGGLGGAPGNSGQPGGGGAAGQSGRWQASPPTHGASGPNEFWIPGPPTYPGRRGYVPPPGAGGTNGADGSTASTADSSALITTIVPLLTNAYWSMLLTNGTQAYYDDDYTDAASLLGWINTVGTNGASPVGTIVNRARVLIAQMAGGLDVYGHPRNYVQALSVGAYETNNSALVSDGQALEAALAEYQQQVTADNLRVEALNTAIAKANAQINKNTNDRAALITQGGMLSQQLLELLTEELAAMDAVNQTSAELQAALSEGHGCTFSEIISAAALIVTVAASFFGPAGIIAGAADAGAGLLAAAPAFSDLVTVVKDVKVLGSDIGQLETAYNDLKSSLGGKAPDPKSDNTKFLMSDSDLATVRAQFETKIKALPASPQKDAYNDAVNHYLDIVQVRNQQLLGFNGLAFKAAGLDDSTSALQTSIAALKTDLIPVSAAAITADQQVQDITGVRDSLLQSVFFELLQQSRALDFWTLDPQDPPPGNDSFDALQGILGTLLARKTKALEAFANPPASFSSAAGGLVIPLSSADKAALAAHGTYSFLISVDDPVFSNLAQVLAGQMTVTFNAADGSPIQPLRLNLEHSGYHKFRDVNGQAYEFLTPPRTVVQDTGGPIQVVAQFAGVDTSLDSANPAAASYSGVSPFTRWKVTAVNDPGVFAALGKAKEISLSVSGTARALVGSAQGG